MIKIENLCMTFHHEILKDLNVEIHKGDVISIIGPSGCGKSTFLRCINLLNKPTSGHIYVDGTDITTLNKKELSLVRQKMGMVFQHFNLFNHMTVIENIMFAPMELLHISKQEAYEEGMKLLEEVGLAHKAFSYPDALSGGQKQRVAIARTLAMHPDIILFDEPTSALDPSSTSEVLAVIKKLAEKGMTMLIITHVMEFAENVSNRVFYMDEKHIYEDDTPEVIFHNPKKEKTKEFIYQIKCFNYEIDGKSFDYYELLGKVSEFLSKQLLDTKSINKVFLIIEELLYNVLFKEYSKDSNYNLTLSYSTKLNTLKIIFEGDTIQKDVLEKASDEISNSIITNLSDRITVEDKKLEIKLRDSSI